LYRQKLNHKKLNHKKLKPRGRKLRLLRAFLRRPLLLNASGGFAYVTSYRAEEREMTLAKYKEDFGEYAATVQVASTRGGPYTAAVAFGWVICPFVVQTVMHPTDAIWLQLKFEGLPVPQFFTAQQAASGFVMAVFALCVLVLMQMVCTVLFYRRAKMEGASVATPTLWPLAAAWGLIADAVWWYATGFDPSGGIVGMSSAVLTVAGEMLVNKLGREFVNPSAQSSQPAAVLYQFPGNGV
jgi:hypothetical protein